MKGEISSISLMNTDSLPWTCGISIVNVLLDTSASVGVMRSDSACLSA